MTDAVLVSIVGGVVSLASLAMTLLIKGNQGKQAAKIDELREQTDGKMNQLLEASNSAKLAEGKLAGLAAVDAKELVKAVDKINGDHPVEVKIVDQAKTIDVKTKKE